MKVLVCELFYQYADAQAYYANSDYAVDVFLCEDGEPLVFTLDAYGRRVAIAGVS